MDIVLNLEKIKNISLNNEDMRWEIRGHIINNKYLYSDNKTLLNKKLQYLENSIDCLHCGNCCRENIPILEYNDIIRICEHLSMDKEDFINNYLHKLNSGIYIMNRVPCPFLNEKKCTVYKYRFDSCRVYPQLQTLQHIVSIGNIIKNYSICPIIFNFYEYFFNIIRS